MNKADVTFDIPVEVLSEANRRECWQSKYRRFKKQRERVRVFAHEYRWLVAMECRIHITLIRIKGPRQRDFDDDNLRSAFKSVRDGIADVLGIDDGSNRLLWEYRQEKGEKAGVRVEMREMGHV